MANPKASFVISDGPDFVGVKGGSSKKGHEQPIGTFDASTTPDSSAPPVPSDKEESKTGSAHVAVIASKSLVEDEALKQLKFTATLPNMIYVAGMPDLHPGKGFPIGVACARFTLFF
jgi:hypothetical protein